MYPSRIEFDGFPVTENPVYQDVANERDTPGLAFPNLRGEAGGDP